MQSRDVDPEEFFSHEVQPFPPSLSKFGNLRLPTAKSGHPFQPEPPTEFDCKVLDGAVIVHCLPVTGATTFDDYASNVFLPYIHSQRSRRVDIVWDSYFLDSLKEATREKRGKGVRRKVAGNTSFMLCKLNRPKLSSLERLTQMPLLSLCGSLTTSNPSSPICTYGWHLVSTPSVLVSVKRAQDSYQYSTR